MLLRPGSAGHLIAGTVGESLGNFGAGTAFRRAGCQCNRSANLLRSSLYVCPICGNILHASGAAAISCCGVTLPPLEAEEPDEMHCVQVDTNSDGEYYFVIPHEMSKDHYISFIAYQTPDRFELRKLYPEGPCEARFFPRGGGMLYWYCNRHGLFRQKL